MSNSRKAIILAVSLLGAFASFGTGCKRSSDSEKTKQELAFESSVQSFVQEVQSKKDFDIATVYLRNFTGRTGVGSSPLKVRGGSMTAFTSVAGGWQQLGAPMTYCVNIKDPSYIGIENLLDQHGDPAVQPGTQLVDWNIVILGHDGKDVSDKKHHGGTGLNPSNYGMSFVSQATLCDGTTPTKNSYSIVMTSVNPDSNPKVGFYTDILPPVAPWKDSLRFQDMSQGYDPTDGGGNNKGKSDGEYRERMYLVTLTPAGGGTPIPYTCPDGECTIYLGAPQRSLTHRTRDP